MEAMQEAHDRGCRGCVLWTYFTTYRYPLKYIVFYSTVEASSPLIDVRILVLAWHDVHTLPSVLAG